MPTTFCEGGWAGRGQITHFLYEGKLSFKAEEPEIGHWYEDMGGKRENDHIIIFPEKVWNFTLGKKRTLNTIVIDHFNSILFHKSGTANQQHTYQSIGRNKIIKIYYYQNQKVWKQIDYSSIDTLNEWIRENWQRKLWNGNPKAWNRGVNWIETIRIMIIQKGLTDIYFIDN